MLRLLDDAHHAPIVIERRHAEVAEVLVLLHGGEQDPGPMGVGLEGVDHRL